MGMGTSPDGGQEYVPNELIPEYAARGYTFDTIRVRTENGAQAEIPWDVYVDRATTDPGTLAPVGQAEIDALRRSQNLAGETSTLGSLGRGVLTGASFGLLKPSERQQEADALYHSTANTIGEGIGIVGPALLPGLGEAGLTARAAEVGEAGSALGRIGAVGRTAAELLPGRALAQGGARIASAIGGAKGVIAAAAAEGAGYHVLRAALDDDVRLSGEALLSSAVLGAATAGAGLAVSKLASKAEDAWARLGNRASKVASEVDDAALVARLEQNRPLTAAQRGTTDETYGADLFRNVRSDLPIASANQALVRDANVLSKQVEAWRLSPFGRLDPTIAKAVDTGMGSLSVIRTFAKQEPAVQSRIMGAYESRLHDVDEMAAALNRAPGGIDVNRLPTRWRPENVALRQEALSKIDTTGLGAAEAASQRLATRLTAGTERLGTAKEVADGLLSRIPIVGKLMGGGVTGKLAGLALVEHLVDGALGHAATNIGLPLLAARGASKVVQKAFASPARGAALSGLAGERVASLIGPTELPKEPAARARAVIDGIRRVSPDEARRRVAIATAHVAPVSPEAMVAAGEAAANRQRALLTQLDAIDPPRSGGIQLRPTPLTRDQVRKVGQAVSIASDPAEFARLLVAGKLDAASLAQAAASWPSHVDRAKAKAASWAADRHGGKVSRSQAAVVSTLLGSQAVDDPRLTSGVAAQQAIAAARDRMKQPPGPARPPASGGARSELLSPAAAASTRPSD